jgi:copper transporter 1
MAGMEMFFAWSTTATILFEGWLTSTWYFYLLSCVGVFVGTVLLEGLRMATQRQSLGWAKKSMHRQVGEGLLYGVYVSCSYLVMLIAMTYNVGLFLSVVLGHSVGRFLFSRWLIRENEIPLAMDLQVESCH